jgi:phage tail protein X
MTPPRATPYSRVYWSVRDDDRLAAIYGDDHHLATWLRLLLAADMAWPAPADVPRAVNRASLEALKQAGVIVVQPNGLFRFHGLDAERERRSAPGRAGASARWMAPQSDRNAIALPPQSGTNASKAKQSKDETSTAREGLPNLSPEVAAAWEEATGRTVLASGNFAVEYLDDACRRHPPSSVVSAITIARRGFARIPATQPLIVGVRAILDPFPDTKAIAAVERVADQEDASRRRVEATLRANHGLGGHDKSHPRCPLCRERSIVENSPGNPLTVSTLA